MTAVRSVRWAPLRTQPRVCSKNILIHVRPPGEKLPPHSKADNEIFIQACVYNKEREMEQKQSTWGRFVDSWMPELPVSTPLLFVGVLFRRPTLEQWKEEGSTLGVGCISKHEEPPETRHFMDPQEAWFLKRAESCSAGVRAPSRSSSRMDHGPWTHLQPHRLFLKNLSRFLSHYPLLFRIKCNNILAFSPTNLYLNAFSK